MKNILHVGFAILCILSTYTGSAQSGCPDINAGSNVTLPCGTNCANLTATYFETGSAATYTVNSIAFNPFPFNQGTSILVNQDDVWSTVIDLPFTFCFFDQQYTQLLVGANGLVSFDVSQANNFCAWDLSQLGALPVNDQYCNNSIMGPYHDIDPSLGGSLRYQITGAYPCRTFIVSYDAIPMYNSDVSSSNCSQTREASHQIVLYETTNAIEIYIKDKDACTDWNSGLAIEGIQNANGTVAYTVPGRNNSVWNATNDAWRFTPSGTSIVSVEWLSGGSQVGTGATYQACVNQPTEYVAQATYIPCSGGTPIVVTDTITVSPGGSLNAGIDSSKQISCVGNDGAVYAHVTGGVAPVTYGWSDGNMNLTRTGLAAGTYIFTASDASGCVVNDTVILTSPVPLVVNVADVTQSTCTGGTSGTLVAAVSGGAYPYNFSWNSTPAQIDSILDGVAAGTYIVTVTDNGGCTASDAGTLTIQNTGGITVNPATITNVTCNSYEDGSITVNATSTATLTYMWSNSETTATVTNLDAGTYSVTVTDANGCSATASYNITEPAGIIIGTPTITQADCQTGGSISVTATGGAGTLAYSWSNSQTGNSISGLAGGPYTLTVTDANGCTTAATFTVPVAPGAVSFGTPTINNVSCNGQADGSITATATGGTGAITFSWAASTGSTISNLAPGSYSVTITDQANCSASTTYVITQPTLLTPNLTFSQLICFGSTSGSAASNPTGGTAPYTYVWSTQATSSTVSNLPAGIVLVTVTDANRCSATASGILQQTNPISYNSQVNQPNCATVGFGTWLLTPRGTVGRVIIDATGLATDTVPMANGDTTAVFLNTPSGTYNFTITDSLGCSISGTFTVNAGQANESFTVTTDSTNCFGSTNGSITVSTSSTNTPYTYSLNGGAFQGDTVFSNLSAGTYTIVTRNGYGCNDTLTAVVEQPAQLFVSASPDTIITAPNVENGIAVTIQNFNNPAYNWSPVEGLSCTDCANPTASVEQATVYYITVSEGEIEGCSAFDSVVVIVTSGFVMPNAFTPNGDGKNDRYGIVSFGLNTVQEFRIYNRWGQAVHNSTETWNGAFGGKDQPAGTYVYYIVVERPAENGGTKVEKKQGSFALIR